MRSRPRAMPPCGGVPYSRASRKKPKAYPRLCFIHPERRKNFGLYIFAVDTDGARPELEPVHGKVVILRAHRGGIVVSLSISASCGEVKGVVRGQPAACVRILLEHGEVGDPDRLEGRAAGQGGGGGAAAECLRETRAGRGDDAVGFRKGAVPLGILARELHAEVAGCGEDADLAFREAACRLRVRAASRRSRIAGDQQQQVVSSASARKRAATTAEGKLFSRRLRSSISFAPRRPSKSGLFSSRSLRESSPTFGTRTSTTGSAGRCRVSGGRLRQTRRVHR